MNHKIKKMYFFDYQNTSRLYITFLFIRMIGCFLIGQKIMGISFDGGDIDSKTQQLRIYFYRIKKKYEL